MALAYGMTAEQYFYQDPNLFYNYKKAFELQQELKENEFWLQGLYVKSALSSTPLWVYGLVDGNKMKPSDFPKQPTKNNSIKDEILNEEQLKQERFRAYAYFEQIHKANNKKQK